MSFNFVSIPRSGLRLVLRLKYWCLWSKIEIFIPQLNVCLFSKKRNSFNYNPEPPGRQKKKICWMAFPQLRSRSPYLFQCSFVRETSKAGCAIILTNRHFKWGDNSAIFFIFRATPQRHTGAFCCTLPFLFPFGLYDISGWNLWRSLRKKSFRPTTFRFSPRTPVFMKSDIWLG